MLRAKFFQDEKRGMMVKRYAWIACALMMLWALFASLFTVSLNDEIYDAVQRAAGVNEETCALSDADRMSMNRDVAMYLAGRLDEIPGLSERAKAHMEDVRDLFSYARIAMISLLCLALVFLLAAKRRSRMHFKKAYFAVFCVYLFFGAGAAVFAATDFSGAFDAFHRLLFTNDLWLLDPSQDALIRILPEKFFMIMAVSVYALAGVMYLLAGLMCRAVDMLMGRLNER